MIADDYEFTINAPAPRFIGKMRALTEPGNVKFYLDRGVYYDAVDFDDTVFRVHMGLSSGHVAADKFELVLVDEYQDFNALEARIIDALAATSPIVIAGDDDQALYSQLRDASWDHIRRLNNSGDFEVHKLPYCMRCPKVVVDAANDIITAANKFNHLKGRISKPYKHFPPAKGADSAKYPAIEDVETTTQMQTANYMGRYIVEAIDQIPEEEIVTSIDGSYPTALVIAAEPYRRQVQRYLVDAGHNLVAKRAAQKKLTRDSGLAILNEDSSSNLGWRILLRADKPPFLSRAILATADNRTPLAKVIPKKYRDEIAAELRSYELPQEPEPEAPSADKEARPTVRITSFEGAKGLSAQHVYIVGLHNGELPHDPTAIKDLEICKFIVGLTRTRKKCTLIHTRNFAGKQKAPSCFIKWIDNMRLKRVTVHAGYWKRRALDSSRGSA